MTIPTPQDVGLLLVVADTQMRTFIALCAFAGLRLGEAGGVQLRDVDFVRKRLKVTRQVQRAPSATIEVRAPKYGSERAPSTSPRSAPSATTSGCSAKVVGRFTKTASATGGGRR